jgi:hypothetical protein
LTIFLSSQATPERVQELLRTISYKNIADSEAIPGQRSVNITLDDVGGSQTSAIVYVNVYDEDDHFLPSVVLRNTAPVKGADTSVLSPFARVVIDDNDSLEVTMTVSFAAANGRLILGDKNDGTYDPVNGTYTVTGHPYNITQDLQSLQFDPRDRSDPIGRAETTAFTISVTDDTGLSAVPKTVTVEAVTANRAPAKPLLSGSTVVQELSKDGTAVGTVSGADPNQDDALTYSLVGAEDAPFRLETQGGVTRLVVTNGVKLDHEQKASYTFTLRATDGQGLSNDTVVSIRVDDVNPEKTAGSSESDVI